MGEVKRPGSEREHGSLTALMSPFPPLPWSVGKQVWRVGEGERAASVSTVELVFCFHPCGNKSVQGLSF